MDNYANTALSSNSKDTIPLMRMPDEDFPFEKIAVLFTDIVGSTDYFKVHGDKLGREMLRSHHNIASSIVSEYGGKVVKLIGDSIMACFASPIEAFKAAIKMQKKFKADSMDGNIVRNMNVRVGIHYGSVIVEQEDIYGDVVNVASKLTNLAKGGQIFISGDIHSAVKDMPLVNFELITSLNTKVIPYNTEAYKVYWDEAIELMPATSIMLYVSPVKELADDDFKTIWEDFNRADDIFMKKIVGEKIYLPDRSLMMFFSEIKTAVDTSEYIIDFLSDKLYGNQKQTFLPVQIIIDTCLDAYKSEIISQGYVFDRTLIRPGTVYVSVDVHDMIDKTDNVSFISTDKKSDGKQFYRLITKDDENNEGIEPFAYGDAFIRGHNSPCFYCGSKRHAPMVCPSKKLPDITHSIDRLGYMSFNKIDSLFLKSLISNDYNNDTAGFDNEIAGQKHDDAEMTAIESFYELTRIYQLRFLKSIWDATGEDWIFALKHKSDNRGGMAWLALDSLRISADAKTEHAVKKAIENDRGNFRTYCIMGFYFIEKGELVRAADNFRLALTHAKSGVHRIFIQLIIARIYKLENKIDHASKIISDIISQYPFCTDAEYLDITFKFQQKKEDFAIKQLVKLIQGNRKYFMYAYIDPELIPYRNIITPELTILFRKAKEDALSLLSKAEYELNRVKSFHDRQFAAEMQSLLLKARNVINLDSYFGYLDGSNHCNIIISRCHELFKERKTLLSSSFHSLNARIEKNIDFINAYKYKSLVRPFKNQMQKALEDIEKTIRSLNLINQENLAEYQSLHDKIFEELNIADAKLKNMHYLEQSIQGSYRLLKYASILLSIIFVVGFFVLPYFFNALNNVLLHLNIMPISSISFFQKIFYFAGVLITFCILFTIGIKEFNKID